jgi:hypothetical protein
MRLLLPISLIAIALGIFILGEKFLFILVIIGVVLLFVFGTGNTYRVALSHDSERREQERRHVENTHSEKTIIEKQYGRFAPFMVDVSSDIFPKSQTDVGTHFSDGFNFPNIIKESEYQDFAESMLKTEKFSELTIDDVKAVLSKNYKFFQSSFVLESGKMIKYFNVYEYIIHNR